MIAIDCLKQEIANLSSHLDTVKNRKVKAEKELAQVTADFEETTKKIERARKELAFLQKVERDATAKV